MGRASQRIGKRGQDAVHYYLMNCAARCIEEIATPVITRREGARRMVVAYRRKVSCDFTCMMEIDGVWNSCRIEVKVCDEDRLPHSRLDNHQAEALSEWSMFATNASLIAWVHRCEVILFHYPTAYFRKGKSIKIEEARKIRV